MQRLALLVLTVQIFALVPQLQFFDGRRHPCFCAVAVTYGPACSENHRDSAVAVGQVVDAPAEQVVPCPLLSTTGAYGQTVQKTAVSPQLQFVDEVVDISVVVQRQFPMVLFRTMEILQLQYTNKVIDVPVVPVLFPSAGVEKTAELQRSSWTR